MKESDQGLPPRLSADGLIVRCREFDPPGGHKPVGAVTPSEGGARFPLPRNRIAEHRHRTTDADIEPRDALFLTGWPPEFREHKTSCGNRNWDRARPSGFPGIGACAGSVFFRREPRLRFICGYGFSQAVQNRVRFRLFFAAHTFLRAAAFSHGP